MSIKRTDRMREVLSLLRDRGEVSSTVLCAELRVSVATLRRDLIASDESNTHRSQSQAFTCVVVTSWGACLRM